MNNKIRFDHHVGAVGQQLASPTRLPHIVQMDIHQNCGYPVVNSLVVSLQRAKTAIWAMDGKANFPKMKLQHIAVAIDCWFRARRHRRALFYPNSIIFQRLTAWH
jgi:hypothetical protein